MKSTVSSVVLMDNCIKNINTLNTQTQLNISEMTTPSDVAGYESIIGDTLDSINDLVYKGLSGIRDMFITTTIVADGVKQYRTNTPDIKTLNSLQVHVLKSIKKDNLNVPKIYNTKTPVTLGLNVKLEEMCSEVTSLTVYTSNIFDILSELDDMLDDMTSSKISDIKTHLPRDMEVTKLDKVNKSISKTLAGLVSSRVTTDIKPVKDVVSKINTLPTLISDIIKLGKQFKSEDLLRISDMVDDITDKVTVVIKTLNMKGKEIDKATLYKLSNYLKVIAEQITVVTFTYYSYYQLTSMVIGVSKVVINEKSLDTKEVESFWSKEYKVYDAITNTISKMFK